MERLVKTERTTGVRTLEFFLGVLAMAACGGFAPCFIAGMFAAADAAIRG